MNDKFDELAKGLAHSVTRRAALKKFGLGLAGAVLASFGLTNTAEARGSYTCCTYEGICYETGRLRLNLCVPPGESCPSGIRPCIGGNFTLIRVQSVRDCRHCK